MNDLTTVIEKAKQFAEDNYELGFDVYVECFDQEDWEKEATDDNGKALSWSQLKARMKHYVGIREEMKSNCW